jgi:hypothetical protein
MFALGGKGYCQRYESNNSLISVFNFGTNRRKAGTSKVPAVKDSFEATPNPSLRSIPSTEGQASSGDPKRPRLLRAKDSDATPFSVEELFKGME